MGQRAGEKSGAVDSRLCEPIAGVVAVSIVPYIAIVLTLTVAALCAF